MKTSDFLYLERQYAARRISLEEYRSELKTALMQEDVDGYDAMAVDNMTLPELECALQPYLMFDHQKSDRADPYDLKGEWDDAGGEHTGASGASGDGASSTGGNSGNGGDGANEDTGQCADGQDTEMGKQNSPSTGSSGEDGSSDGSEDGSEGDDSGDGKEQEKKHGKGGKSGKAKGKRQSSKSGGNDAADGEKDQGQAEGSQGDAKQDGEQRQGEDPEGSPSGEPSGSEAGKQGKSAGEADGGDAEPKQDKSSDRDKVKSLLDKKKQADQDAADEKQRKAQEELEKLQRNANEHAAMDDVMHMLQTVRCCLLVGPTGTGKSTLAKNACCKLFHVEDAIQSGKYAQISFSPDTTSGEMIGRSDINGKFHESEVVRVFRDGGLILFDEIDDADAAMLIKVNTALANGYLSTPNGMVTRHRDTYIVCAANTFGTGPDAMYVGRSRLDAATLDRFTLATVYVDYDEKLEARIASALPKEEADAVLAFVGKVRKAIRDGHLRRACSTRFVINAVSHLAAGKDIKWVQENYLLGWKENERNRVEKKTDTRKGSAYGMEERPIPF